MDKKALRDKILCGCGCGHKTRIYQGKPRIYIYGHYQKTKEYSILSRKLKMNEANPTWKGDNVSYRALHSWIRRHYKESNLCQMCKIKPPFDLANITGIYNRDFTNWKYLCRKCHMILDGRIN